MSAVRYDLVVDFARPSKSNTIIISEGDTNSRITHFTLLANKTPMNMIDVTSATVRGVKEDGSVIFGDATIITDDDDNKLNEIEYVIPASVTDTAGNVTMTITLLGSDNSQITSFEFYLKVRNALYNEDDYVSESDLSGFRDLLTRCLTAVQKIEAMTENTALPNPYPLNLTIEDELYSYTGSETLDIILDNLTYLSDAYDPEESTDESAAAAAAASAISAANSAYNAGLSATSCSNDAQTASDKAGEALGYKNEAQNQAGIASGYATQCRAVLEKLNLPTSAGTYVLSVNMVGGVPQYIWNMIPNIEPR